MDQLCSRLSLSAEESPTDVSKHCNACVALGCLAEKMAGQFAVVDSSLQIISNLNLKYWLSRLAVVAFFRYFTNI